MLNVENVIADSAIARFAVISQNALCINFFFEFKFRYGGIQKMYLNRIGESRRGSDRRISESVR